MAGQVTMRIALAAAFAALLPAAGMAQEGPPPGNEAAAKLKPIVAPAQPTAPDALPLGKLRLPSGFRIELYAGGIPDARSLRVGPRGTVFVASPATGKVFAIDGQRAVKVVASGLHRPNGLAILNGALYIAEVSRISKIDNVEDALDNPPKPVPVYEDLPKDEANSLRFLGVGPDGSGLEVVAAGVRNTVGFDFHPKTKELWFTDNGRDWLSEDAPNDELNRVTKPGESFGAPFCYQGNLPDSEFGWGHSCDEFTPPVALLGPHVAPLGMRFYTGRMFPRDYNDAIASSRANRAFSGGRRGRYRS